MRTIEEDQLKRAISADLPDGIYFIYGNEAYLKKHYCSQIFNRFDDGTGFNLQQFDNDSDFQQVYDAVCQLPFMSERKCVSICDLNIEEQSEISLKYIYEAMQSVGDHCVFVIWYNTTDINITTEKAKAFLAVLDKCGGVVCKLGKKTTNDIANILCNGAAKRGCKLDPATARYMIEQCGDELTNLVSELDKLCAYVGEGQKICQEHIDKVCIRTIDVKTYQLGSAILDGNATLAMDVLNDLLYINYDEMFIFGAIVSPIADIIRVRMMGKRSIGDVAADFGKKDFVIKKALTASNKLDNATLDYCIKALNDCDTAIKFSSSSSRIALEQLVITLCGVFSGRR